MLNTLNDINYSFNQTVEEMKLESLVNVHSKATDSFSKNEMMIESLRDEYSKTIGSFADMQLETKTATEMMIESLRDEYSRSIETKATDSLFTTVQESEKNYLEKSIAQQLQLSDLSCLNQTIENRFESELKMMQSLTMSSILEEESLSDKLKKQQLMYSALTGLDAITRNSIGSSIAGFNDNANQLREDYLANSINSQRELLETLTRTISFQDMKSPLEVLNDSKSFDVCLQQLLFNESTDTNTKQLAIKYIISKILYIKEFLADIKSLFDNFASKFIDTIASIKNYFKTTISPSPQYTHFLENLLKQHFYYKLNTTRP